MYRYGAAVRGVIAGASAWLGARVVLALGFGRREMLWSMVFVGLASPLLIYSRGDFAQPLEGLCWLIALLCALKRGRWYTLALGFVVFYAILTRPVEGSILAAGCFVLVVGKRNHTIATVAGGAAGGGGTPRLYHGPFRLPFSFLYAKLTRAYSLLRL